MIGRVLLQDREEVLVGEGLNFAVGLSACIVVFRLPGEKLPNSKVEEILLLVGIRVLLIAVVFYYLFVVLRSRIFKHNSPLE